MKDKDKNGDLILEQLYVEHFFLRFCQNDEYSTPKIGHALSHELLAALEKDNLVIPLKKDKQVKKQPDGTEKEILLNYYSPFQIFLVSALGGNKADEDEFPRDYNHDVLWQKQQNVRFVSWGGQMSFNAQNQNTPERKGDFNVYHLAKNFHNLVLFIHTHPKVEDYEKLKFERNRYFTGAPIFQFDFGSDSKSVKNKLKKYSLSVDILKNLKHGIASYAMRTDPLEHWFYYLEKHPQWRKDKLKGAATLAQDLYGLCRTIDDIIQVVTGEKPEPLPRTAHPDFLPLGHERIEYAGGTDLIVLKDVFSEIKKWIDDKKNKQIIKWISVQKTNFKDWEQVEAQLSKIGDELADFENRYGEKRYLHGFMRTLHPEKKLKLENLDDKTRNLVQGMMSQKRKRAIIKEKDGKSIITTSPDYKDVIDLWRKGKKAEAIEKHFANEEEYEITRAIESRLDDIGREMVEVCAWMREALWGPHYQIENEKKTVEPKLWFEFRANNKESDPDYAKKHYEFWNNGLKKGLKKWDDNLGKISTAQKELSGFINKTRLAYCAVCRKKTVQLHHGQGDKIANSEMVCDECFNKASASTLEISEEEWINLKYAEWKCDCGKLLYKFVLGNTTSLLTRNGVPIKINVEYGRVQLDAKCPSCGKMHTRHVDWGWLP